MFSLLYVDDEPGLLEIGKMFLEQSGRFSVDTLTSADEALRILDTTPYDAIISDYQMPGMDGIEFLKRVRASGNAVPFIIFTGRGREEIVIQALNEGADFYLQKGGEPVSQFAELGHKVRKAILQRRAEASIRNHERREADILNFLPDATFAIDTKGVVIAWNRAMEKMTGVHPEQVLGKNDYEYATPFYHERRPILIDLVLNNDRAVAAHYPYIKRVGKTLFSEIMIPHFNDGKGATLWFTASPLYDTGGNCIGAIESIREITEWKQAESALTESEEKYRLVVENSRDIIFIYKNDRLVFTNSRASELTGYTRDELLNMNLWDLVHPDDRARLQESARRRLSGEPVASFFSARILTRTGEVREGEFFVDFIIFLKKPAILGIFRDVTELNRADRSIRESEQRYRNVVEDQTEFICRFRPDGTHVFVNEAYCRYFHKKREEIIGHHFQPQLPKEDQKKVRAMITTLTPDNPVGFVRQRVIFPDTSVRWQHWVDRAIFDENGTLKEYQSVGRDITDVMNAELALEESERRYRNVVEDQTEFICRFRPDGTHVFVNDAYCRYFGLEREEIIGHRFKPEIPLEDQEIVKRFFVSLTPDHPVDTIDHRIIMSDGRICWQRWSDRAIFDSSGTLTEFQSVGRDVTDTKEAEKELQSTHMQLTAIEEELRAHYEELAQSDERLRESEKTFRRILENMQDAYLRTNRDGNLVMVNPSAARLYGYSSADEMIGINVQSLYHSPESRQKMVGKLKERGTIGDFEGEARRKDGSLFWASLNIQFITDDRGTIQGTESTVRDITERKRMEHSVQETNRKLSLLSGITRHDVVNQLTILQGYRKIAAMKEDDPVIADFLVKIDATAQTIARQIEFTKTYEELGVSAPAWFRLDEIIARAGKPEVVVSDTCRNADVFADPMLERVFFNLFDNATRHGERVTKIVICCEQASDGLLIIVEDNGIGIPLDEKEKIFEKGFGKNTGFGLFLVREILAITGITVTETGEPGKGARFEIVVPKGAFRSA
jgi:PAS domain S-box-containing protein